MKSGNDSDGPEEITAEEGIKQDEEIRKVQRENLTRVAQEGKERRRQWAQRKTQAKSNKEGIQAVEETEQEEAQHIPGMLPSNIVDLLAAREKQTFASDSEEEVVNNKPARKKKRKSSGPKTILLKEIPPSQCLQSSMEFLKRRKMQVSRSSLILKNADQALRLLSSQGNLLNRS